VASNVNPEFEKFWARYEGLLMTSVACGEAKQAFYAAFVTGELAEMEQDAGREAHSSGSITPPKATEDEPIGLPPDEKPASRA